jgi:hypothetical protein
MFLNYLKIYLFIFLNRKEKKKKKKKERNPSRPAISAYQGPTGQPRPPPPLSLWQAGPTWGLLLLLPWLRHR